MDQIAFLIHIAKGIFAGKSYNIPMWEKMSAPPAFASRIVKWNPRTFVNGTLRGVDLDVVNDQGVVRQLRILEQNPHKTNPDGSLKLYAQQARNGSQICWVIDRAVQQGGFLGRIQDGVWYPSQDRAYSPRTVQAGASSSAGVSQGPTDEMVPNFDDVPEIPSTMTVSNYTSAMLDAIADMEPPDDIGEM